MTDEIKLRYYSLNATVDKVNHELGLSESKRKLTIDNLHRWRSDNVVVRTNKYKVTERELEMIKGVAYLHYIIGVPMTKLNHVRFHMRQERIRYRKKVIELINQELDKEKLITKIHQYV
jgi:hypothetical protein